MNFKTYTPEEIKAAVLKTADKIEAEPELLSYYSGTVAPKEAPMCIFAWIGYFLAVPTLTTHVSIAKEVMGLKSASAIVIFDMIGNLYSLENVNLNQHCRKLAPAALRSYAAKIA